jgi:very-short-patch-repair endonuclease
MTPPERRLWNGLRGAGLGVRFRRQHPVPPYVLDFACVALRLAVEVDGGTHGTPDGAAADAVRDGVLAGLGWRVVRFSAGEVMGNLQGVLGEVLRVVEEIRGEE